MLSVTRHFIRGTTPRELRSHLRRLQLLSKSAQKELHKRRRRLNGAQQRCSGFSTTSPSSSGRSGVHVDWLPKNDALESAIALAISENRDARTELEFTRHFLKGSFISLASPVGQWDPYDTKPQVFALDKYISLPVFTSLAYLRFFCQRFKFTVRDPSGMLWVDGLAEAAEEKRQNGEGLLLPDVSKSEWWERHMQQHLSTSALAPLKPSVSEQEVQSTEKVVEKDVSWMDASDLFDPVAIPCGEKEGEDDKTSTNQRGDHSPHEKKKKMKRNRKILKNRNKGSAKQMHRGEEKQETIHEENSAPCRDALHEAFWAKVRATAPFQIKQATPLPVFGPLLRPFFVGYFADVDTLLHNASIVPEKVDIVLNPASPIEFVLAREATDRVLHKDQLLHLAYRRVEKELRGEFHRYFRELSPEVRWARSACVPTPVPGKPDEVKYELVILLQSEDFDRTFSTLRAAKHHCLVMGHSDLDVLPWDAAAPYVKEASSLFYERDVSHDNNSGLNSGRALGVFEQKGPVQTISMAQSAESFYHDPTASYTESHAVFTEELKLKRRVR